jgi:hypothetical protein
MGDGSPVYADVTPAQIDSSIPPDEAGPTDDAGTGPGDDAAPEASICTGLGAPCKDSTTCLCGTSAGCTWDNVQCVSGKCTSTGAPDSGDCCSMCQATYDGCTSGADTCMSAWTACNTACGSGMCPVVCLAELGM